MVYYKVTFLKIINKHEVDKNRKKCIISRIKRGEIGYMNKEEIKKDLLDLKKEINQIKEDGLTGYASIDKPWVKYYNQEELEKEKPKRTVYQEVYENNKDYKSDLALEFFGTKINYNTFFDRIEQTAKSFEEYGIKKGDFVTICAAGVPETVYSFYALSKIGAISNMIAPHFDKKDLVDRIEDCESDILIVMDTFYGEIKEAIKKSRIKNVIVLPTLNSSLLRFVSKNIKLEKHGNELFWNQFIKDGIKRDNTILIPYKENMPLAMVYSSGTTGASKGILLSNDSFQNSIQSYLTSGVEISRGKKFYQIIPTWYSTGLSTSIHLPLSCGSSVFMDPRFERNIFVKNVIKAKPNYTVAPTSMYEGFLEEKLIKDKDLSFFNYPFEGGEPLSQEVANKIESVFRKHGNNANLRVGYGQCECGATITTQTSKTAHLNGSVGIPLPNINIGIFDNEYNEMPYYERGQILADTPCSMIGYYNNPDETKKYFHVDKNGTKWNCTGDIGYINENGELIVQGRATDYTIINGKQIYNFDIESIISSFEEVKMCDVLDKKDENGNVQLAAHIIFNNEVDEKTMNNELIKIQEKIYDVTKDIDMVPSIFKVRTSFPYAKSGKRDTLKIKSETDGFIYLNKFETISEIEESTKVKQLIK